MLTRVSRLVAIAVLVLSGAFVVPRIAAAVPIGTGGWTKITTPSRTFTYNFNSAEGAVNQLRISGTASPDVSAVNIYCGITSHAALNGSYVASNVQVQPDHTFTTLATIPSALGLCRLRAFPTFLPDVGYTAAFSGPLMYSYTFGRLTEAGKTYDFAVATAFGSGVAALSDPTVCAIIAMTTVDLVDVEARGPGTPMCGLSLLPGNINETGTANASSLRVDDKNAYLPATIWALRHPSGDATPLTVTQPSITTSFSRNSTTGDVTVSETAHLWRCSGANTNTYPPTPESCPSIVDTGVTFKRLLQLTRGNHQVLVHDSYSSNNGHLHTVTAQYTSKFARPGYGGPGFVFPRHGTTFKESTYDQVVTGFGTGPATVLVRSDLFASSTDPEADTQALTWSRPPAKIQFSHNDTSAIALPYTFHVLKTGAAKLGLAMSEAPLTTTAKALAAKAAAAF
jgi:hypothetical protein